MLSLPLAAQFSSAVGMGRFCYRIIVRQKQTQDGKNSLQKQIQESTFSYLAMLKYKVV